MAEQSQFRSGAVSRRMVLSGLAAGLAATGAFALAPRRAEHRLLNLKLKDLIPNRIGPWHYGSSDGLVVAHADEALPTDGYDQLVGRTYEAAGGPSIMLLIAYGSTQGATLQLHRPETCYPGQGFRLSEFSEADLSISHSQPILARRFTATRDERIERLLYWTRIAESFPGNTAGEYRAILGSVLRGIVPDGVLVRMSTIMPDATAADRSLNEFALALLQNSSLAARQILVGNSIAAEIGGEKTAPA